VMRTLGTADAANRSEGVASKHGPTIRARN
jgi:hypothetical protein